MVVFGVYKIHISGWLLAITAIGLTVASAYFVDDPDSAAKVLIWAARITAVAVIWRVLVSQYGAWRIERNKYRDELAKKEPGEAKEPDAR